VVLQALSMGAHPDAQKPKLLGIDIRTKRLTSYRPLLDEGFSPQRQGVLTEGNAQADRIFRNAIEAT